MNREAIYGGFWNALRDAIGGSFVKTSRTLEHWADVPGTEQPALFQTTKNETGRRDTGKPGTWELRINLYVYARSDAGAESYPLNPLLDAITNFLSQRHAVTGRHPLALVLPGVQTVDVDGVIETDEGVLGDQQIAIVPVVITATD
jgi:hypothetical protein